MAIGINRDCLHDLSLKSDDGSFVMSLTKVCGQCFGEGKLKNELWVNWEHDLSRLPVDGVPDNQPDCPVWSPCRACCGEGYVITENGHRLISFLDRFETRY